MYDIMMLFKPSSIKDYKNSYQFSCKIQVKTSDNTAYNHNTQKMFTYCIYFEIQQVDE
jgi:hypothetical protein